ncbi:MAG TPA: hypothetical protein VEX68_02775 [Bryobacteraceae bacterium]|nr:hypothetical protein [Bryobacteraceae bacterium]
MRMRLAGALLLYGLCSSHWIRAQGVDPNLIQEVSAVRVEVLRSKANLRQYTWIAHTEVSVKGDVKSSSAYKCGYDQSGNLVRTLAVTGEGMEVASGVSKKPKERRKAEMQDYIERAVTRIYQYIPPDPEQIDLLLKNGSASLGRSTGGASELRFKDYFERGDTVIFTYDSASKALLRASVASSLGSAKDPVTLEAVFERLPDGVNHVSTATLNATAKKVQVNVKNVSYEKLAN